MNQILGLRLPVTGVMGPETRSAVRSFQQQRGLPVDGIVGPQTEEALRRLQGMNREELEPFWIEINTLEEEGDRLYRYAVAELFSGDHPAMDVLRWKEVIENLEEAIDGLENVANVIESTVVKHA